MARRARSRGIPFESAVDPVSGLLVQQVAICGTWKIVEGERRCYDERARVIYASHGLPAGLGTGPLWNGTLYAGPLQVSLSSPHLSSPGINYTARPLLLSEIAGLGAAGVPRDRCLKLVPSLEVDDTLRPLTFQGGLGSISVCDGFAFPVAFEAANGARFTLEAHQEPAGGSPELTGVEPWDGPLIREVHREPPLFVDHPEHPTPFPVPEAHEQARRLSSAYDQLFRKGGGTMLVGSYVTATHQTTTPVGESNTFERDLHAVDRSGETVKVRIEKRASRGSLGPASPDGAEYALLSEEHTARGQPLSMGALDQMQAGVAGTVRFGEVVIGTEPREGADVGLSPEVRIRTWGSASSYTPRTDGYTLRVWFIDPVPNGALAIPYGVIIDGPTAEPLWFDMPRAKLPFGNS